MEYLVEPREEEQLKIFFKLKKMFQQGSINVRFKKLKPLKYRVPSDILRDSWNPSAYNQFLEDDYFKILFRKVDGENRWLAIAKDSKRQYVLIMR